MHQNRLEHVKWLVVIGIALGCAAATSNTSVRTNVRPGIEVLLSDSLSLVRNRRVGFVTNVAAVDSRGVSAIARLRAAPLKLVALFAPEHGLTLAAAPGEKVASSVDSANTPIYSLYGRTIAPTDSMLAGIDVLLIDLPDVGARYYTYIATTVEVMKAAARHHIPVVILDRPNPLGGAVEGNILDTAFTSMVGRLAVPMRHGLTLGEEARLAASDLQIPVDLKIVVAGGWTRTMLFGATGLPFKAPSPNLQTLEAVQAYPGTCLFEGTALSVGRGTDGAFLQVGAPWLDTAAVIPRLAKLPLAGVTFSATTFTPHTPGDGKFADTLVAGVRIHVTDPSRFRPVATAVAMLAAIQSLQPDRIKIGGSFDRLAGGKGLREAIVRGDNAAGIVQSWETGLDRFNARARPFQLYRQ